MRGSHGWVPTHSRGWAWVGIVTVLLGRAAASDLDEFRVKRETVFEFAQKPLVTREGDRVTITFETQGSCDVTVAIEEAGEKGVRPPDVKGSDPFFAARIVRHLASGVLGPNAPEPFEKNSKRQTLIWDGKDDQGRYLDDKEALAVRVSLGLKPQFERSLYWEPKKRISDEAPLLAATPAGVYVFEGKGLDHLRLFDHAGNYARTVYPFPAENLDLLQGVKRFTFPQDGRSLPLKGGFLRSTLLTSGPSSNPPFRMAMYQGMDYGIAMGGSAARAMAVQGDRIYLADLTLNRLGADGPTGGQPLEGPKTSLPVPFRTDRSNPEQYEVGPQSLAVSPDGRWLYLTGYIWRQRWSYTARWYALHCVARLDLTKPDAQLEIFIGSAKRDESGRDNAHFTVPTSVACDGRGNVYVSDFINDRVQVFAPDGRHLKTIPVRKPALVRVHQRTGEIYVFSWLVPIDLLGDEAVPPVLTIFSPLDEARKVAAYPFPIPGYRATHTSYYGGTHVGYGSGQIYNAEVDSWADRPTIWFGTERQGRAWKDAGLRLLVAAEDELRVVRDFGRDVVRSVVQANPPVFSRQRLHVNPRTGRLFIAESRGYRKSEEVLVEVDPETGGVGLVDLPWAAEDVAFGPDGLIYLRTPGLIARYDPDTWREVPFDYGVEREQVGFTSDGMGGKRGPVTSGILTGATSGWHQGGFNVSVRGRVVASCYGKAPILDRRQEDRVGPEMSGGYQPVVYPGRARFGEIHVWDEHGKRVIEDAVPGLGILDGVAADKDDNVYVLFAATRVLDGTPYFSARSETLIKFDPRKAKALSGSNVPTPMAGGAEPKRPPDLISNLHGQVWLEGAQWLYGGLGFAGKHGCACWNARFALDYFARSFAPELDHASVAVLDTNGNLILRVGRLGNVDDGRPLAPSGASDRSDKSDPSDARSIGGDEVALFYAPYVATHTDRRLFIADPGNGRIVSVRLGYHATERVALKDIGDGGPRP